MLNDRQVTMQVSKLLKGVGLLIHEHEQNIMRGMNALNARRHIDCAYATVYVRVGMAYMTYLGERGAYNVICLASVSVPMEYQRQGVFKRVLAGLSGLADRSQRILTIEQVLNEDLDAYLRTLPGWHRTDYEMSINYYRQERPDIQGELPLNGP